MTPTETGAEGSSGGDKPWTPGGAMSPAATKTCEGVIEFSISLIGTAFGEKTLGGAAGVVLASSICDATPKPNVTPREENASGAGGASGH